MRRTFLLCFFCGLVHAQADPKLYFSQLSVPLSTLKARVQNPGGGTRTADEILSLIQRSDVSLNVFVINKPKPRFELESDWDLATIPELVDLYRAKSSYAPTKEKLEKQLADELHWAAGASFPVKCLEPYDWKEKSPAQLKVTLLLPRYVTRAHVIMAYVAGLAVSNRKEKPPIPKGISGRSYWMDRYTDYSGNKYYEAYQQLVARLGSTPKQSSFSKALDQYETVVTEYQAIAARVFSYDVLMADAAKFAFENANELGLRLADKHLLLDAFNRNLSDIKGLVRPAFHLVTAFMNEHGANVPETALKRISRLQENERAFVARLESTEQWYSASMRYLDAELSQTKASPELTKRLWRALVKKDTEALVAVLEEGVEPNQALLPKESHENEPSSEEKEWEEHHGRTPLTWAVATGQVEAIKVLVSKKADIDLVDFTKHTALMVAADTGNVTLMKVLIAEGADVNADAGVFGSPLIGAAENGRLEAFRYLLQSGANLAWGKLGWGQKTAVYAAAHHDHADILKSVFQLSDQKIAREVFVNELVYMAENCSHGGKNLLEIGKIDPNIPSKYGSLALVEIVKRIPRGCGVKAVMPLLEAGADPKKKDKRGDSAMSVVKDEETRKILTTFRRRR